MLMLKVSKYKKKIYDVLNSSTVQTKLTILSTEGPQDNEFCSFFGRIREAIICFQDLLTFTTQIFLNKLIENFFLGCMVFAMMLSVTMSNTSKNSNKIVALLP